MEGEKVFWWGKVVVGCFALWLWDVREKAGGIWCRRLFASCPSEGLAAQCLECEQKRWPLTTDKSACQPPEPFLHRRPQLISAPLTCFSGNLLNFSVFRSILFLLVDFLPLSALFSRYCSVIPTTLAIMSQPSLCYLQWLLFILTPVLLSCSPVCMLLHPPPPAQTAFWLRVSLACLSFSTFFPFPFLCSLKWQPASHTDVSVCVISVLNAALK